MQEWKVRGKRQGKRIEVLVQAADWASAMEAARQAPHRLAVRDAVLVGFEERVVARLCARHGWHADRILTTVVSKDYPTAVGLKNAVVRTVVPDNGTNQLWLTGEYVSEGSNALVGCMAFIPQDASQAVIDQHVDAFAKDVDARVAKTYAARLLK